MIWPYNYVYNKNYNKKESIRTIIGNSTKIIKLMPTGGYKAKTLPQLEHRYGNNLQVIGGNYPYYPTTTSVPHSITQHIINNI